MYPTPLPSDECLDPVLYPEPWDNGPVPAEVLQQYPQSCHKETIIEPQNKDDQSIIDVLVDENEEEPRGNSPLGDICQEASTPGCKGLVVSPQKMVEMKRTF
jgi:hypothetical protein